MNDADVAATMASTEYYVSKGDNEVLGRVSLRIGAVWPTALRTVDAVEIQFTAGWSNADALTSVPRPIKQAMLMMAAWLYSNRGDCDAEACACESGANALLGAYRQRRI